MSETKEATKPLDLLGEDGDLTHDTCCEDADITLCGLDSSKFDWAATGGVDCIVCNDLCENHPQQCPKFERCLYT